MSNSEDHRQVETQARSHMPAVIAIIVALGIAALAFFFFYGTDDPATDAMLNTPPEGAASIDAAGTEDTSTVNVAPEGLPNPPSE